MILKNNILIVDSRNLIDRFWYASQNEESTIKRFLKTIDKAIKQFNISHLIITSDTGSKNTCRHKFYSNYKFSRSETPSEIQNIKELLVDIIEKEYNTFFVEHVFYEADDFIASAVEMAQKNNFLSFIMTTDKDLEQLINKTTFIIDFSKNMTIKNHSWFVNKYRFKPSSMLDYLSLMGDSSDSIPGVSGIGKTSAQKLLKEYSSMSDIYKNIDLISPPGLQTKLKNGINDARLSYSLVKLRFGLINYDSIHEYLI